MELHGRFRVGGVIQPDPAAVAHVVAHIAPAPAVGVCVDVAEVHDAVVVAAAQGVCGNDAVADAGAGIGPGLNVAVHIVPGQDIVSGDELITEIGFKGLVVVFQLQSVQADPALILPITVGVARRPSLTVDLGVGTDVNARSGL